MWKPLLQEVCVGRSHLGEEIRGEEPSEVRVELSLMRPRNLINLVEYCRSNAVNLGRDKIGEDDVAKAIDTYLHDVCMEIGLETRDVFPIEDGALYAFVGDVAAVSRRSDHSRARASRPVAAACSQRGLRVRPFRRLPCLVVSLPVL